MTTQSPKRKYESSYPPKYRVSVSRFGIGLTGGIGIGCVSGILSSLIHIKIQLNQSMCIPPRRGGEANFEKRKKNHYRVQGNLHTKFHNDPSLFQEMGKSVVVFAPYGKGKRDVGGFRETEEISRRESLIQSLAVISAFLSSGALSRSPKHCFNIVTLHHGISKEVLSVHVLSQGF